MSFTCAKCGVPLDLQQGPVILGEDESHKLSRWIQQAGNHMGVMHPEVVQETMMYTGLIGGAVLMRYIKTDNPQMLKCARETRNQIADMIAETAVLAFDPFQKSELQ